MKKSVFAILILAFGFSIRALAGKCEDNLHKPTKPDRKTLGPGALLRLKSKLKAVKTLDNGWMGTEPAEYVLAYAPDVPLFAKESFELSPNQTFRTLSSVFKNEGGPYRVRVEILPDGEKAVMYWVDVYNNALVEQ